jgi:FG-GAP repeat/Abnormal spindle-like microcephaly-assoc'd, ASPM-SPD-2-Hydin
MPSSLLPLSSSSLLAILISMLALVQSSRAPLVNQPNGLPIAQASYPGVSANLPRTLRQTRFVQPGTRAVEAAARPSRAWASAAQPGTSPSRSSTGLCTLPGDAQGPISAALGKDDSRYWSHATADGFHAENPQHALVVDFTGQGAEVRSQKMRWGLETRGYGYGGALHPLSAAAPHATANRVEYRRGSVIEWYENGPLGLEQGFTLTEPPGKAKGQLLTVALALSGNSVAAPEPPGLDRKSTALTLRGKDGQAALRYTGLNARDATGRQLRSWLELRGQRLLLRVEDSAARYPLVVDPWIQQAALTASDGEAGDDFGDAVAFNGSTIVVGAPSHQVGSNGYQGAVYVFVKSSGGWSQKSELTASDGEAGDNFGDAVALNGSTLVVGAYYHQVGSNNYQGAAYVFVESSGAWSQKSELTASDGGAGDNFGDAVAVNGSTIVVGAPGSNGSQGAAYVFLESGGTWSQQAELTASDGDGNDNFGDAVAVDGSTVVVGAPRHPASGCCVTGPGAAYAFVRSGTTWSQQAELTASDGAAGDSFGYSVAVSGSTAVVGAPYHGFGLQAGAAYVFVESSGTWSEQQELSASDLVAAGWFGFSVAVDGNTTVVGSPGAYRFHGAVYIFDRSGTTWSQQQELITSDIASGNDLGTSVALSGSRAVVGAGYTAGANTSQGAAYVFGSSGPLYTLSAAPSSLSVGQGGQAANTVAITPWNGFSRSVSFSASGLPNGVTAAFSPNPATSASTLTLTASTTATTGPEAVIVVGTSGNLAQTTPLTLTVTPAPEVTLSPSSVSFGEEALNGASTARAVVITNTGNNLLDISGFAASASFAVSTTTCKATLAVGKKCTVSVTFTPTELGALTGTLSFADNAPNSPQTETLSGTGVEPATLTPPSASYGAVAVGTTSATKTFTLTNHNQTMALTSITINTTGDFAVSGTTCTTSLAANGKCTISVTLTPTTTGKTTGQLSVSDSASNSPQTASLTGTGK